MKSLKQFVAKISRYGWVDRLISTASVMSDPKFDITIHSKGHNMIFTTCGIKTNHENFEIICGKYIETWLIRPTISTASIMSDLKFDYNIFHSTIRNNNSRSWETLEAKNLNKNNK